MKHDRFPTNTNGNTIDLVLSLADHYTILFDLNLPVSQINRPSR